MFHHVILAIGPIALRTDETIILRIVHRDALGILRIEGLRHLAAHVDRHRRIATAAGVVKVAPEPAVLLELFRIAGSLPDFRRAKMGAVGVRVTDTLNNRELTGVVKRLETGKPWMQANLVSELQYLSGGNVDSRSSLVIEVIPVRHHCVQTVIAAGHLEDNEYGRIAARRYLR